MRRSGLGWLGVVLGCGASCGALPAEPGEAAIAGDVSFQSCGVGSAVHAIAWSADGTEIFYVAFTQVGNEVDNLEVKAVKADGGGTWTVEPYAPQRYYRGLAASPDASAIYVSAFDTGGTAPVYTLIDIVGGTSLGPVGNDAVFAASGDDRHVVSVDVTATIFDVSTGAVVQGTASAGSTWAGIAFSPAGDRFFLSNPDGGPGMTLDLSGNLVDAPSVPTQSWGLAAPSWNADGLRVLFVDERTAFQIFDVTTGSTTAVGVPPAGSRIITACAAWSRDGAKAVFWDNVCTDGTHSCSISKGNLRTDIYVADAATGVATSVVGAKGLQSGDVAISPDGKRLAYTSLTTLSVIDLP